MKDTIISAQTKKRELLVFATCFGLAFVMNIAAIIIHQTQWIELLTQLHVVLLVAIVLYGVYWIVRLLVTGIRRFIG